MSECKHSVIKGTNESNTFECVKCGTKLKRSVKTKKTGGKKWEKKK